ncbi:MAG: UDP-2,3-diacylglucosamine diphosphatase [Candidatus Cloacimonadaceae bacterium]|jgi:UDP-2,3-diacylglucosamine hydrolase|nr:UDP-2,3-diacylglucosamine diphosphatase [Candidatus Cloacimonadota bacterium]MDX9950061.1 UDP-2,3-diacylglucosamine diphosphatase [Candidatus Syntrophosphaera sp.]
MRICVVSDVHLKYAPWDAADRENARAFQSFLKESVGKYDLLVLNGDIFDLWFDWKSLIIKEYFPVLHRLAELSENGCKLVMISGNHDFWFNDFFSKHLNAIVRDQSHVINADGKKMYFTHGDLYTYNDIRYKILRGLIRLPISKGIFSLFHPEFALRLGAKLSRSSRFRQVPALMQRKKSEGLEHHASYKVKRKGYDIVCMGHSHKPEIMRMDSGVYANSGDWTRHRSYLEIIDGEISLKYYHEQGDKPC